MKHNKEQIHNIGYDVEAEYKMGGLSSGLYMDFATDVAIKYTETIINGFCEHINNLNPQTLKTYNAERHLNDYLEKQPNRTLSERIPNSMTTIDKIKKLTIAHNELGNIEINTEIPEHIQEQIGDTTEDYTNSPKFYHADISKLPDGTFDVRRLKVIKPDCVDTGWMNNSKGSKNFVTIIKNISISDKIQVYPKGIISVEYKD